MGKKEADAPAVVASVVAPEFHCDFAKINVTAGGVKVWGYSDLTDPTDGPSQRVPAAVMSMPIAAFDLFLADCLKIRASLLTANGSGKFPDAPILDMRKAG